MKKNPDKKTDLFEYKDYRLYLKDWFAWVKAHRSSYSYRVFAAKAGFKTSNFLMLVMQGRRNLTEESIKKFSIALDHTVSEQEFFRGLVYFNQGKSHEDKNHYYQQLLQSKKYKQQRPIESRQYEYYSSWYHPVIREMVVSKDFDGTPESISKKISPAITPAQVTKSIALLESLGFIHKNSDGAWQQSSSILSTGPELTSLVVHNYHRVVLDLSKAVMDHVVMAERDFSSMTLGVAKERIVTLREKIRVFRKEVLQLVSNDTRPDEVVLLNMQFFPVTKVT
jgi:uncharacterized protein (TIGR02147 family)